MIVPGEMSWLQMLFTNRGGVLTHTLPRVVAITGFALAVTAISDLTDYDFPRLTLQPFQLVGVSLGIFLAFRNNAAYDRFWEGRKLWGSLVNTSRSLSRQVLTFIAPPNPNEAASQELLALQRRFIMQEIAFVNSLRHHLRRESPFEDLTRLLPAAEVDQLRAVRNVPVEILRQIGVQVRDAWRRGWIHDYHVPVLEQSLIELTNIQGACERILNTPFPFPYTVLMHRIVAVYCLFLCFGLVHDSGWATPFIVFLISHAFFGFDEIGDELEQPFGHDPCDLPLNQLCGVIEANLRQMLGENNFPLPTVPANGIVS
jgi:putative membrane protein